VKLDSMSFSYLDGVEVGSTLGSIRDMVPGLGIVLLAS
jgi:hypothetical protein